MFNKIKLSTIFKRFPYQQIFFLLSLWSFTIEAQAMLNDELEPCVIVFPADDKDSQTCVPLSLFGRSGTLKIMIEDIGRDEILKDGLPVFAPTSIPTKS